MVFSCSFLSLSFEEEEELEYLTPTKSTSQSYHTPCSDFDGKRFGIESIPNNFQDECPDLPERPTNPRVFTLAELKSATTNFCRSPKIGESGSGSVRTCRIKSLVYPYNTIKVSVKLRNRGFQVHKQLSTEVNELWKIEHPNIVKPIGYCDEFDGNGTLELMVLEFMANGSLRDHLSAKSNAPLSWARRLQVALDTACGLAYLHEEMDHSVILRDFTPSNILLDKEWHAKLLNYGYTPLDPSERQTQTHVSGYAAPEYVKMGQLTTKSNVWSYGVLLYVLITGWPPLDPHRPMNEQKLLDWVKPYLSDDKFCQIVDSRIEIDDFGLCEAKRLAIIANNCLRKNIKLRPKMSQVLGMLDQLMMNSLRERSGEERLGVLHEPNGSMKLRFKGKRRCKCLPCVCSWKE